MAKAAEVLLPKAIEKHETYELLVIYKPMADTEGAPNPAKQLEDALVEAGGKIVHADKMGRRRLAYPIDRQKDGYIVSMIVNLPVTAQPALRRTMKLDETVLRASWLKVSDEEIAAIQKGPTPAQQQRTGGRNRR